MTTSHKICSYTPVFIQMFTLIPSTFHLHSSQSNLSRPLRLHQQGLESQCVGLLYLGVLGKASLLFWPFYPHLHMHVGFPGGTSGKEPACQCRRHETPGFNLWVGKIPWRRKWQPTSGFLPGRSHGQRSLTGYSPGGCKRARHK